MLTAYSQRELIEQAKAAWVFAYLLKPVREQVLGPTLDLAAARFKEWQALQAEVKDLQKSLEVRDLVERAKRALIAREQLTERQAYDKIHRASRTRRVSMQQVAEEILRRG
jgi:two-component system, response regulator PdtaR